MLCSKCGHKINEGDRFCFSCGTPCKSEQEPEVKTDLGKIPALSEEQKKEVKDLADAAPQPEPGATEVLGFNNVEPDTSYDDEITEELFPPENQEPYAVLSYKDGEDEKKYMMMKNLITIGRDSRECDLPITGDKYIGRSHAIIFYRDDKFFLADFHSKNGTFINGERFEGVKQINDGDTIKIATTEMKFKKCK